MSHRGTKSHAMSDFFFLSFSCPGRSKKVTDSKASEGMPHVMSRS